jgi:hypothetical protein
MAKSIIAHPGHEATKKEKTASCSGCSQRFPRRLLVEVHDEHVAFGSGVRIGERYCKPCVKPEAWFDAQCVRNALYVGGSGLRCANGSVAAALGRLLSHSELGL